MGKMYTSDLMLRNKKDIEFLELYVNGKFVRKGYFISI